MLLAPMLLALRLGGVVDQVKVYWVIVTPSDERQEITISDFETAAQLNLTQRGELWEGELTGGEPLARLLLLPRSDGPWRTKPRADQRC